MSLISKTEKMLINNRHDEYDEKNGMSMSLSTNEEAYVATPLGDPTKKK